MFKSLRVNLTLWFICLSALVCLFAVTAGFFLFRNSINSALDAELEELGAVMVQSIRIVRSVPSLEEWAEMTGLRKRQRELAAKNWGIRATVELFDTKGVLLEAYGPKRVPFLLSRSSASGKETSYRSESVRWLVRALRDQQGIPIGYLQIELTTRYRDKGMDLFLLTMALLSPVVILALAFVGYFVAGKAVAPIEQNFALLRQFIADAGHELGSPLAIIQANAEAEEAELDDRGIKSEKLQIILTTTERMSHLVKDLLTLIKSEAPALVLEKTNVALDQLTKATCSEFAQLFRGKDIDFNYSDLQAATVIGNEDSLKRLLTNLLQNALRYTDAKGSVKVSLSLHDKTVVLSVADTGIGIAPESLPHIFDRFYRTDKSRARAQGGAGLGLAIVKAISQQHSGTIEAQSEPGKGCTFTLTLPRAK